MAPRPAGTEEGKGDPRGARGRHWRSRPWWRRWDLQVAAAAAALLAAWRCRRVERGRTWHCRRAVQAAALRWWRGGVDRKGEREWVTGVLDSWWVDPGARVGWNLNLKVSKSTS